MSRGINKVILIGNLGNNPEINISKQGSIIAHLSIATDEGYKDKNSGQLIPKTEWHRVVMFNRLAEIAQQYLQKGSKVYIEGRLQTRKWQDKDGSDRYITEIVASDMQMLDGKNTRADTQTMTNIQKNDETDFYTGTPATIPADFDEAPF